ncbi:MAG: hypothetical protein AB1847_09680 [bacterium]
MMDPITIISTALISGAAAGLKPTAEKAVRDAYNALKAYLTSKWRTFDVAAIESSKNKLEDETIKDKMRALNMHNDSSLVRLSYEMINLIEKHDISIAKEISIRLGDISAQKNISLTGLSSQDGPVKIDIDKAVAGENFTISDVQAGNPSQNP